MKRLALSLSAVALLAAACGGDGGGGGGETTSSLTMVDNEFQPSEFTAGGTSLTVTNEGAALHNLTVADGGIDQDVAAGESADVDLSGLEPGTFDITCKYHPEMTGSLTVQ
jgi:plastocyanin